MSDTRTERPMQPITPRYFYVDDDTGILFAANGTGLTALLIGIADVLPLIDFPVPTYPMWIYLAGLTFAFLSKSMIQLLNGDTAQRDKLNSHAEFLIQSSRRDDLTGEVSQQLGEVWNLIESERRKLLTTAGGLRATRLRAWFFISSALCFLISTSGLIVLAGQLSPK